LAGAGACGLGVVSARTDADGHICRQRREVLQPGVESARHRVAVQVDVLALLQAGFERGPAFLRLSVGDHVVHHVPLQKLTEKVRPRHGRPRDDGRDLGVPRGQSGGQQRACPHTEARAGRGWKGLPEPAPCRFAVGFEELGRRFLERALRIAAAAEIEKQGRDVLLGERTRRQDENGQCAFALLDKRRDEQHSAADRGRQEACGGQRASAGGQEKCMLRMVHLIGPPPTVALMRNASQPVAPSRLL